MKFDLDLSLGNIISLLMFLVTIYALHHSNTKRLGDMEAKLDVMYRWFCENVLVKENSSRGRFRNDD